MRPQNPTTFRVLSPPPTNPNPVTEVPKTSPTGPPITGYNKIPRRDARATSVEKITRLLERKSMPRERVVSPPPQISPPTPNHIEMSRTPEAVSPSSTLTLKSEEDASDRSLNASPEKFRNISNSNSLQRIGKPKFLQNLEKKWEKLTSPSPQPVREFEKPSRKEEPAVIMPQDSSDESEAQTKPDSESMLLQRAVSPEKKLRSKFGASTVNYMLGKFKRFEESSSGSKIPAGKPPVGSLSNSKIGRRVQSVYAGACSDSVLTLPRETTPSPVITNGIPDPDKAGHVANPSKSRISPRLERAATVITNAVPNPASAGQLLREADTDDSKQKPHLVRRPVSLGIFSGGGNNASSSNNTVNPSNTNPSLIPRFNRNATPQRTLPSSVSVDNERTPINECPTPVTEAPQIHIIPDSKISDDPDDNLLTPTSISDSFDSSSICSEKTEMSKSVLDDEESVSDRIFRKSFYPRFNSLDRKKSKSTPSNPRHYTPKVGKSPVVARSSLSPSNNFHESLVNNFVGNSLVAIPAPNSMSSISPVPPTCSSTPSPTTVGLSSKINKYNPNPLFKELITDDFKTEVGSKAEYSRRVTSKLSKLLKEIESDIGSSGATTSSQNKDMTNNLKNSLSAGSNAHIGKNRKSLSPIPGRFIDTSQQQTAVERSGSTKSNNVNLSNNSDSAGKNG
ncbi:unnamed protein product [Allacma fusca]|uniref:Uncharacterized protein n=1 Tax=Allacma fusca TaxID=39272 RepID=A0A8J2JL27_9HEXA|nr:unnamed protein product [Allacma fusca]